MPPDNKQVFNQVLTGHQPYKGFKDDTILYRVVSGLRLPRPVNSVEIGISDDVWGVVVRCWSQTAENRPDVLAVLKVLNNASRYWVPRRSLIQEEFSDTEGSSGSFPSVFDYQPSTSSGQPPPSTIMTSSSSKRERSPELTVDGTPKRIRISSSPVPAMSVGSYMQSTNPDHKPQDVVGFHRIVCILLYLSDRC
jgi:hypothetical protein